MSKLLQTYLAYKLTEKRQISDPEKLNSSIRAANIDLNPHQVDAAIFAFKSPLSRGAILADEVGLGKTIEAGLILDQLYTEGRRHILILVPASLRTQWQDELTNRFSLPSTVLDGSILKRMQKNQMRANPLENGGIFIASHNFAYRYDFICGNIPWDLVVIDEAHRLRNVWKKGNKTAKKIREVLKGRPKILLTATPLQNNLMELYGLTSFLDDSYLGTEFSFKTLFANPVKKRNETDRLKQLRDRLMGTIDTDTGLSIGGILTRTLRKQVAGLVPFTYRHSVTENFAPNDDEIELYSSVSDYLHRPWLASTRATQRNMMELVYRKILASSSFAIAGTLHRVAQFLAKRLQVEFGLSDTDLNQIAQEIQKTFSQKYRKELPAITFPKIQSKEVDLDQEVLPGLEDLEINLEKVEEEKLDADDLGEDEIFDGDQDKVSKREIDHKFTREEVLQELRDILGYYYLASTIDENQKSQALVKVLAKVFQHAEKTQWPQKAVIFTESRRTQDHLEKLLGDIGYNLILFNGTNASKRSKEIFEEWAAAFPKEAEEGNKSINVRKALVWKFKNIEKGILITTEAGAEGLNLQFANIVINYDLPWNPQRIEQRIGRCHRYGQKLDVLVINFINMKNYAEQRVYELLSEKIKLFGNLFDFTDKVLGTEQLTDDGYEVREVALGGLGAGLDFERKILSIYRKCRTEAQIEKAFQQLQFDFQDMIREKVEDAQRKVIQHFDAEVRQKLRVRQQILNDSLSRFDAQLRRYLFSALEGQITQKSQNLFEHDGKIYYLGALSENDKEKGYRAARVTEDFINEKIQEDKKGKNGVWEIKLRHSADRGHHPFEGFVGKEGQLTIDLLTCVRRTVNDAEESFERIIITGLLKNGDGWEPIQGPRLDKLFDLDVERELSADGRMRDELEDAATATLKKSQDEVGAENEHYIYEEMDRLTQFVQESLLKFQQEMDTREREIKELQKTMRASRTMGSHDREQIQGEIDKKQKDLFRAQKRYIQAQEEQFSDKDKKVSALRNKLQMTFSHERIASVRFTVTA
jgi:SNF2 family DNA or RNA helicase